MISGKNILITGGAGFIGSNMAQLLFDRNSITILDDFSEGNQGNIKTLTGKDSVTILKGDITDEKTFDKLQENFDLVIHLAANSDVRTGSEYTGKDMDINVKGTYNVLEFMKRKKIPELMFSSSSTVYGEASFIPTPENYGPCLPISTYGASKLANEGFIWSYYHYYGIRPVIYRFANIVGRNSTHGVIHDFLGKLKKNNKELEILGDGTQEKSYMHVDDCIGAMILIYEKTREGEVVNLGNAARTSVRRIADIVCETMGLDNVKYNFTGGFEGRGWKGDIKIAQLSIDRMLSHGWKNRYGSDESVYKASQEIYKQRTS
jgi:UDP-glucose 4-epimerase